MPMMNYPRPERDQEEPFGPWIEDAVTTGQIVGAGRLYQIGANNAEALKETRPPLADVPNVQLERPLVILPGWTTKPDKFDHLVARLTDQGANGGQAYFLKDGTVYADPETTQPLESVPPEARIFIAIYHDTVQPPDQTAPQIDRSLETLRSHFPGQKFDALGYSLGGVATRVYLDQGGDKMGKVMLLGTSNHGTRFATLATRALERDLNWALSLTQLSAAHLPAMAWMSAPGENGQGNPELHQLNQRWQQQVAQTEAIEVVGADGLMTPSNGWWPMRGGDGLVEQSSLAMGDVPVKILEGKGYKHHGNLPHDSDVYNEMIEFYGWTTT